MKKAISIILVAVMLTFVGCTGEKTNETADETPTVRIAVMTGATAIGAVKLMSDADNGTAKNEYDFSVVGTADEITPKLVQGQLDIAAVPANLASVLYNKTNGGVKLLAVNTLGVLYIVTKGVSVSSVAELKGKTIYATGKGAVPEYTLRHVLEANGIKPDTDVTVTFTTEPKEIVALMKKSDNAVAMLPEPYVTVAKGAVDGLTTALNLTEEWDRAGDASRLVTGVFVVRTEFAEAYPEAVSAFLAEYRASAEFAVNNVSETAVLLGERGIFDTAVAEKALPNIAVVSLTGDEMKTAVSGYLGVIYGMNPQAVGGKLPDDNFYYKD